MAAAKPRSIQVKCGCGRRFRAASQMQGRSVVCPACGQAFEARDVGGPDNAAPPLLVGCRCGARFKAPAYLAGRSADCPRCGAALTLAATNEPSRGCSDQAVQTPVRPVTRDEFWSDTVVETTPSPPVWSDRFSAAGWREAALQQRNASPALKVVLGLAVLTGVVVLALAVREVRKAASGRPDSLFARALPEPTWNAHRHGTLQQVLLPGKAEPTEKVEQTLVGPVAFTQWTLESAGPTSYLVRHVRAKRETLVQRPSDEQLVQAIARSALQSAGAAALRMHCSKDEPYAAADTEGEFSRDGVVYYLHQTARLRRDDAVVLQWITPLDQVPRRQADKDRFFGSLKW